MRRRRRENRFETMRTKLRAFEKAKTRGLVTPRSIIEVMAGEGVVDTTAPVISAHQVSQDLMVFDAFSRDNL
jgi:hypothetical protein